MNITLNDELKQTLLNHPALCYFKPVYVDNGEIVLTAFDANGDVIADQLHAHTMEAARMMARQHGLIPMTLH